MATYTPNLNLEKPLQTELYNVDVFNANADKIDAGVGARAKYTDALTLEEIIASTDLTNKVASASAAKSLKESLSTTIVPIAARTLTAGQVTNDLIISTSKQVLSITPVWSSANDMYNTTISIYHPDSTSYYARVRNTTSNSLNVGNLHFYVFMV
ncbi:MAG TPA: hypothetical protein DCF66_03790 [Lachnospiraceae bacterium]|nr:hypothetical protein [Lachnospiraceae bacterium]